MTFQHEPFDTVQFTGIDKVEALGTNRKGLHIDFQPEFPAGKVQDLRFIMPVVFHERSFSHGMGAIDRAGKRFRAMRADFF